MKRVNAHLTFRHWKRDHHSNQTGSGIGVSVDLFPGTCIFNLMASVIFFFLCIEIVYLITEMMIWQMFRAVVFNLPNTVSFNTVYVMVTLNHKIMSLLSYNCEFPTTMNHNINI